MKTTKRILSLLLALALGLALLVPAMAADEDPYAPIITKQFTVPSSIRTSDTLVLEIEAELPQGVTGELSYAWYDLSWGTRQTLIGSGPKLELDMKYAGIVTIGCRVTNTYMDGNNEEQAAHTWQSEDINLDFYWWEIAVFVLFLPILPIAMFGPWGMMFLVPFILPLLPFLAWLFP